jgi:hypothetical protein
MSLVPPEIDDAPLVQDLYGLAAEARVFPHGLHAEFGVATGASLRRLRKVLPPDVWLYGFDSFEGLPEPWRSYPAGSFRTYYRVDLPNTELVVGLFEDTVPAFAAVHPEPAALLHVDCDLYSSTRAVLLGLWQNIQTGTVIIFDELFGYAGFEQHEWRALQESGLQYEVLGRWTSHRAVVRITSRRKR